MNFSMIQKALAACALAAVCASTFAAEQPMLADRHVARGSTCKSCHPSGTPGPVDIKTCLGCHGGSYAKLAERTDEADINPHDTHIGEADCSQCHSGHKKPQLVCDQCHEFQMRVP